MLQWLSRQSSWQCEDEPLTSLSANYKLIIADRKSVDQGNIICNMFALILLTIVDSAKTTATQLHVAMGDQKSFLSLILQTIFPDRQMVRMYTRYIVLARWNYKFEGVYFILRSLIFFLSEMSDFS
jgi:hypothetical protein